MENSIPSLDNRRTDVAHWEHFDHKADIGVRGFGPTKAAAFEQAALALVAVITDPLLVQQKEVLNIECDAVDVELLLVEWLNAIIYQIARRKMLFSRFDVSIEDHHLSARIWGEHVNIVRHQPAVEIKGATFTELGVRQTKSAAWSAQCVVDV